MRNDPVPTTIPLEELLDQLSSPDERLRERAVRRLLRRGRTGFTSDQGVLVLKASSLPYPARRDRADDTAVDLIRAALYVPFPEYLPHVVERYKHWSHRARAESLRLLMRIEDRRAAEAVMTIVRRHARSGEAAKLPAGLYAHAPQHAEVFFPELLEYLDVPKLAFSICALALSFAAAHQFEPGALIPFADAFLALYAARRDKLLPAQRTEGVAWRWESRYHRRRWQAGVLLDLVGHTPTPNVEAELRRAVAEYTDPRLRLYALLSLLRHDRDAEPAVAAEIATDPESRKWLFDGLQKLERTQLYPAEYRTQAALAESDLVNWLIHPAELGRAPEEVELVRAVPFDTRTEDGWADYYLFRFRTESPHWAARYDWIAGVAGPFLRKDQPTIESLGDTFSAFTPWDRKTEVEHVDDVRELMKTWRERHVQQEE
jgi:hypothetical protein